MSQKQTRRRGSALERAILDAAWEELAERGWAGFTVEGVATRSGTARTVIYRRWRNRVHLAQEMLQGAAAVADGPFQSSGDLRTDLISFLRDMSGFLESPFGSAARGVICEGDLGAQQSLFAGIPIVARVSSFVDEAQSRGELTNAPSALALNLGHAVVMSEFLHTGSPPQEAGWVEFVDSVWLPALRFVP